MGLVDTAFEHASFENVAAVTVAGVTLYYIWSLVDQHVRIRRLGNYGPTLRHRLPLGTAH